MSDEINGPCCKKADENKIIVVRFTVMKSEEHGKIEKEIIDLEFKDLSCAKTVAGTVNNILANGACDFICFGPDYHGFSKCIARSLIDSVECMFIEDPQIEKAKNTIDDIRDKVNRILKKQEECQLITITPYVVADPLPYVTIEPWPHPYCPHEPIVVTYMVVSPPDSTRWWWGASTRSTLD